MEAHAVAGRRLADAGDLAHSAAAHQPLSSYWAISLRTSLVSEKNPHAGECETQFRIWPRPNLSHNDVGFRKRGARGVGMPRPMFRLATVLSSVIGSRASRENQCHYCSL